MTDFTDHHMFDRMYDEDLGEYLDDSVLLEGAESQAPIVLRRHTAGALVNIEHKWVVHSPTGFEWGYGGSGPAELALNILGLFVPPPEAWRLHQRFKWEVVAEVPRYEGGIITAECVIAWLRGVWAEEGKRV